MKTRKNPIKKSNIFLYGLIGLLGIGIAMGILAGCGKLNDDSVQPSTPAGTSGYSPIPYGPKSTAGTFTLSMVASPESVPADGTNYSTITVTLSNTSGLPVAGYTVNYTADKLYGWFYEPESGEFISEAEGVTDQNGVSTKRFYGTRSGQGVARAEIDVDENGTADLVVSKPVTFTPGGSPSSAWPYTLTISASPSTIYANGGDYSTIVATLTDASGGSVENFTITFDSELGVLSNDPVQPTTGSTTATAMTNKNGSVSLYYYGTRMGSAVISASVYVRDLMKTLQAKTVIKVLEGPGKPGEQVEGVQLRTDPEVQILTANDDGYGEPELVKLTTTVWDATGDLAMAGVQVTFSGDVSGFAYTDATGVATLEFQPPLLAVGSYAYKVTACTYGVQPQQEQYCDSETFTIQVTPADLSVEINAIPESIEMPGTSVVLASVMYAGQPLAGASVTFRTSGLLTPSTTTRTTDSTGIAEVTLNSTGSEGTETVFAIVTASINGYVRTATESTTVSLTFPAP